MNEYWNSSTPLNPENLNRITRQIATDVQEQVRSELGDIDAALDGILAIQESLIGGNSL